MLIRFTVENFLSFKKETEFNMLVGDVRRHPHHVYRLPRLRLLKSAVIYGANGAGKSNLLWALQFLIKILKDAHVPMYNGPFKLDGETANKPSKFEIEFYVRGKAYAYGLVFGQSKIVEEWLYLVGVNNDDQLLFERKTMRGGKHKITFHPSYTNT